MHQKSPESHQQILQVIFITISVYLSISMSATSSATLLTSMNTTSNTIFISTINSQSHISLVFMYEYSVAADNFFCHQSDFLQRLLDNKVPEIKRETPAQFSKTGTVIAIIPFLIHTSVFIPTILQNMGWVFSQFSFQFASRHKAIAAKS